MPHCPKFKHIKACKDQKEKRSCKNTPKINKERKIKEKKKNLGLPPKQHFF